MLTKKISELPYNGNPALTSEIEFKLGGTNYRTTLNVLMKIFQDYVSANSTSSSKPYWVTVPMYNIDPTTKLITVDSGGEAYYNGAKQTLAGDSSKTVPALVGTGVERFDALLFDTSTISYTLLIGEESVTPSTPAYNAMRYLLLGYIHSSAGGVSSDNSPNSHVQNTDKFLDYGGPSQVSAAQLKVEVDKLQHYTGYFDDKNSLPLQTRDSFALVGNPATLYVFDRLKNAWAKPAGLASGFRVTFDSDLDNFSPPITMQGPINSASVVLPAEIASVTFQTRTDIAGTSFTSHNDVSALKAWVDANVTNATTKWILRFQVTFTGVYGETSLIFNYE